MFKIYAERSLMEVIKGDTVDFDVTARNYAFVTGDTVVFTVRKKGAAAIITKTVTTFTAGVANIKLTSTETGIDADSYLCDVQCTLQDGTIDTVFIGTFIVREGVTE